MRSEVWTEVHSASRRCAHSIHFVSIRGDAARREREQAFTAFFTQNWGPARRFIERVLIDDEHTPEDVDELVNEVFLLAWQKWDRPAGITMRWLEVVAVNKIRDRRRRLIVMSKAMDAVSQALIPESPLWDEWDRLAVRNAVGALKDRERQALALSYIGGWSTKEIGVRLGMAPSAVGAMLTRARAKIRRSLEAGVAFGASR
ncbi:RNA polymerase sigma factor [Microbacterium natoriense]